MHVKGATNQTDTFAANAKSNSRLPLPLAVVFCVYLFFVGTSFIKVVPIFSNLFAGLQVEIPWLTRLLLLSYWWALPFFSFMAIALAVVRQIIPLNRAQRRAMHAYLFFAAVVLPSLVVLALYMPTLKLMWKVHALG
jgi:type II secretory pathway component PulF